MRKLSDDLGIMVARRSASLSKTYTAIGLFLAVLAVLISGLSGFVGGLTVSGIGINSVATGGLYLSTALPLVSAALQVFAAIVVSTPVLLLFVYDKNNGVLEYFLSIGMSQGEIYRQYLRAALVLASLLVGLEILIGLVVGLVEGTSGLVMLEVAGLVVLLAIPVVSFQTLSMMSFSSLQKQRVGSNQPLGTAIAVFMVLPAYLIPITVPSIALEVDLSLAAAIGILAFLMYLSASRFISREKLLP